MKEGVTSRASYRLPSPFGRYRAFRWLHFIPGALLMAACLPLLCSTALAEAGTIHGRILDPQGASVSDVKIKLLNAGGTKVAETVSDTVGPFQFSPVDPGRH